MPSRRLPFVVLLLAVSLGSARGRADQPSERRSTMALPAEERRLSTALFREGLRQRGLTELLELHLRDFPPASPIAVLLMTREVKLAVFADRLRSAGERSAAISEANRILEQLIRDNPNDTRRFEWLFTLGNSLLYDEAQSHSTNILYTGGNDEDRQRLAELASRAVIVSRSLVERLKEEYALIDGLSVVEFEQIEGTGYLDELDRISPNADYLLVWALFYDCLPRLQEDPALARQLNEVLATLSRNPGILETPQEQSHVQVPAMLLAGMTHRRLNDQHDARKALDKARIIADRLADPAEQDRVRWAVTLAEVESVRNDRDAHRWGSAMSAIERLRESVEGVGQEPPVDRLGIELVAALLERSLYRVRATAAEEAGRHEEANEYGNRAWRSLATLALSGPDRRKELYATLYRLMGPDADPERLDPIDQAALIAGLLSRADSAGEDAEELVRRAVRTAEQFLANLNENTRSLAPEMLRQLGVAHYRIGQVAAAADRFLEIARDYPSTSGSFEAAKIAVQLAAELYGDTENRDRLDVRDRYLSALRALLDHFPDTDAGRYWRFFYAQLLEESGDHDAAAAEYALVDSSHEHYLESAFLRLRCLARALELRVAGETPGAATDTLARADDTLAAYEELIARATTERARDARTERAATIDLLLAKGLLHTAEVAILPRVGRYAEAITRLTDFERNHAAARALAGRLWRVRLLAYEALGQLDDATQAIPAYVDADPRGAGRTLQSLYDLTAADAEALLAGGNEQAARRKSETALVLAEQIDRWADACADDAAHPDRRALTVQRAEANLHAGRYEVACELFERTLPTDDGVSLPVGLLDLRALYGHAESLLGAGDFDRALPTFNLLATRLSPTLELRWRSLLGDLRCRTALARPPEGIIKVIEQQKYLYPDMGGPNLAPQFATLLRENERRIQDK